MTIFAVDSAGKTAGVALWRDGTLVYESYLATGNTHSETMLSLCDAAFAATKTSAAQVDYFAVCAGPGSFTGLRIGLALVKGLAFARQTPCVPVSTLEALAYSACADGILAAALDARRGEVYCALFLRAGEQVKRLTPDGTMPAIAFAQQAAQQARAEACVNTPVLCLGDGAALVADAWQKLIADAAQDAHAQTEMKIPAGGLVLYPAAQRLGRAGGVCGAAMMRVQNGGCVAPEELAPRYHRLSQAERERADAEKTCSDSHKRPCASQLGVR